MSSGPGTGASLLVEFFVDDIEENVAGAAAAGFDAALYTSTPQLLADLRKRGLEL